MKAGFLVSRAGGRAACVLVALLGGCALQPRPLESDELARLGQDTRRSLFDGQEPINAPLTLAEATARALKYHVEQRQRQMEEAVAAAQLDVARFDLLPRLTATAGYTTRSNEAFGFGVSPGGAVGAAPSASQERDRTTGTLGFTWNVLDFGVSYFRARQLADQSLIAEERRRKAAQTLMHDVRVAWWRAEAAERLLPEADNLLDELERAIEKTRLIEARKLLPPVQIATLRRAMLDLNQQIAFRRQDLAQAKVDLASLVNAPPGTEVRVASPGSQAREVLDLSANLEKLEALALAQRPEMAEEGYRSRITEDEARKSLVSLLPGLSFDLARNYDSNRFLVNNTWTSAGATVALNLVRVFSLPALKRSEEAQRALDEARRRAMAMAVLTQLHIAAVRYSLVADEFFIWDEAARDDDLIVEYIASSQKAGIDNELELIRTRARAMASHINRDLSYANLQASVARLYNSVGYDAMPKEDQSGPLSQLAGKIQARYSELERASFTARPDPDRPGVGVTSVTGADARIAALVSEGVGRVITSARLPFAPAVPDVRLELGISAGAAEAGRVPVTVRVTALLRAGSPLVREFRTTLSEPVDEEQWRVVGEGAAYRVIGELKSVRITRPLLRVAERLEPVPRDAEAPAARIDHEALSLRLSPDILSEAGRRGEQ